MNFKNVITISILFLFYNYTTAAPSLAGGFQATTESIKKWVLEGDKPQLQQLPVIQKTENFDLPPPQSPAEKRIRKTILIKDNPKQQETNDSTIRNNGVKNGTLPIVKVFTEKD